MRFYAVGVFADQSIHLFSLVYSFVDFSYPAKLKLLSEEFNDCYRCSHMWLFIKVDGVAPDNSQYPLCTTLYYYGYKPSANTTILTVDPKSTQLMTTTKTPEQLQAEAEQSGWLSIWGPDLGVSFRHS